MIALSLSLQGLDGLKAQLEAVEAEAAVRVLRRAARKAFLPVLETAKRLVSVDTGLTRDALKVTVTVQRGGDEAVVTVGLQVAPSKGARKHGRATASPHWRWHFIELGTARMSARPFLRPALDQNAQLVVDTLKAELLAGLRRALKRQGRAR